MTNFEEFQSADYNFDAEWDQWDDREQDGWSERTCYDGGDEFHLSDDWYSDMMSDPWATAFQGQPPF